MSIHAMNTEVHAPPTFCALMSLLGKRSRNILDY